MSDKTDYATLRVRKPGWMKESRGLRRGLDVKRISPPHPQPLPVAQGGEFKAYSPRPGVVILPAGHPQCFEAAQKRRANEDWTESEKVWGWAEQKKRESNERIAERFAEIRQQYNRRQTTPMGGK